MARDYDEKRDFFRMTTDCVLSFTLKGENERYQGTCINLSAGGVLFNTKQHLSSGDKIELNITPDKSVVPPLNAVVEIIRCTPLDTGENEIAGTITELL